MHGILKAVLIQLATGKYLEKVCIKNTSRMISSTCFKVNDAALRAALKF